MIIRSSPTGGHFLALVKTFDANIVNIGIFALIAKNSSTETIALSLNLFSKLVDESEFLKYFLISMFVCQTECSKINFRLSLHCWNISQNT